MVTKSITKAAGTVVCSGCGQPLATGSPRGRPARYHNAACRQRARRARLATHHHATLDTLAALETAARDLRHALLSGQDIGTAQERITTAVTDLAQQLAHDPTPAPEPDATPAPDTAQPVTKHITKPGRGPHPAPEPVPTTPNRPPASPPQATPPARAVKTVDLREQIGPGWTLVQHEGDAEAGVWRVHHDGHPVGTVRRGYDLATNTRGWEARTAHFDHVPAVGSVAASRRTDRLWRTRNAAAAAIATRTQRSPTGTKSRRRRSG